MIEAKVPLTIGLIAAFAMFLAVWSRINPVKVIVSVASPEIVSPGDKITFTRAVTTLRPDCRAGRLTSRMIDHEHHVRLMELPAGTQPPPIAGDINSTWMVPELMAPGRAIYASIVIYPCFPFYSWWPVVMELPEVPFWVKASGPTLQSVPH